jgi:hypothetical protein
MYGNRQPRGGLAVRIAGVGVLLAAAFLMIASGASAASSVSLCVSSKQGVPVTSGACPANTKNVTYTPVVLPSEPAAQQTLISILPYIKFAQEGVGGKPTIQVTGANLQIVSGSGKTNGPVNGAGNLIVGYDEVASCMEAFDCFGRLPPQTGSHNLVLGSSQEYTSYGAILGGLVNRALAPATFAVGVENKVSGPGSSVSGGMGNTASGERASVSGGSNNTASGIVSSVSGGHQNKATEGPAWVGGGFLNTAESGSVVGGFENHSSGLESAILGGSKNTAALDSTVSGGKLNTANGFYSSVSGGRENTASAENSSVSGGLGNTASAENSSVSGGVKNTASGERGSSVSGGEANTASGNFSSILGGKDNLVETEFGHFP